MNALYVICGLGLLSLMAEIVNLKKGLTLMLILGLITATVLSVLDWNTTLHYYNDMVVFDNLSLGFTALIIIISIFWFWMARDYFSGQSHQTDRSALVLFAIAGAVIMVSFNNMAMLFLGIEVLSLSLYALAGSNKESLFSNEASFKYFLMGSFATGFLLMGMALVYGATGTFHLNKIAEHITITAELPSFFYAGVLLMLVGLAFKISAVPFHFWAPDVYDGAPVVITAFMATVVKIAAVGAFYKVFSFAFPAVESTWRIILQVITVLTLIVPNITAVFQVSVKRMLAYSSIGHIGYILLGFISNISTAPGTIFFYLVSYTVTTIAAFSVLHEVERVKTPNNSFNGLAKRSPLLAFVMTVALLSLAGIPPLAGFFAKYLVLGQALNNGFLLIVGLAIGTSLVGVFYYFRVIIAMYLEEQEGNTISVSPSTAVLLVILVILTLLLGLFPDELLGII